MVKFQTQKGFLHFLFANQKDRYLLSSLVMLDLRGYLYCTLKKHGYQNVFFVSGAGDEVNLDILDETSRSTYLQFRKSKSFLSVLGFGEFDDACSFCLTDTADGVKNLLHVLKKAQKSAFVFQIQAFHSLFTGENAKLLQTLSQIGCQQMEQNGSALIMQFPLSVKESLPYLTDPNGVLCSGSNPLCPELTAILQQEHSVNLYEQLAADMGGRCVFLNDFTKTAMELAVKHVYLTENTELDWTKQDVKELAAFLQAWHTSAALRKKTGKLLSDNPRHSYSVLLQELKRAEVRKKLERAVCQLKEEMPELSMRRILEKYPSDMGVLPIVSDDVLAKRIGQIRIPDALYENRAESGAYVTAKFQDLVRQYQTPRSHPCAEKLKKELLRSLSFLEHAVTVGDTATLERAVKSLELGVTHDFRYGPEEENIWTCEAMILQISEATYRLDELIRDDEMQVVQYERDKRNLLQKIKQEKAALGEMNTEIPTAKEHALSVKMHEAVNLDKLIENTSRAKNIKMERKTQNLSTMHNLELVVSNLGLGLTENIELVMQDAVLAFTREVSAGNRTQSSLESLDQELEEVLQEISAASAMPLQQMQELPELGENFAQDLADLVIE